MPYIDAGDPKVTLKTFELSVLDCIKGLVTAIDIGWYSFKTFDYQAYEKSYTLSEGDMNWVIPKRILAFSSPVSAFLTKLDGVKPANFIHQFKTFGIQHIIRLNDSLYDEEVFTREGIQVHDLEFPDGSCPEMVS